jgi:hypothetical protein
MGGVEQAFRVRGLRPLQDRRWSGFEVLLAVLAEFRRAVAAEQRYEHLRWASAGAAMRDAMVPADLPRRIFEEFYS